MAKQLNVSLAFTANTNEAIAAIKRLQKELNSLATGKTLQNSGISQLTPEIQRAMVAAGELQAKLESATNLKTGKLDISQFSDSLKKGGVTLQEYANQLNALGPAGRQAFTNLAQSIIQAEAPLIRCNSKLKELGTTLANTARWQISSSILHGFMGTVSSAYRYAQDLNESLNNIRIVTGQNTDQMAKFAAQANKAAKALSTTTTKYTDASLIYYQQGLSDSEVAKRTEVTVKMANAAGQSAQTVSDQLTAVWNNFYDGSKSLEYYADAMTALGAATASSTDEIAGGLEKFAAVADTIGLSYEYAASALATITSNTRQSEEVVGTALKTIFARIQGLNLGETLDDGTTLNKYSQALQKVGISVFEINGEIKSMDNILDEMAVKWQTLAKDQQIALAQTVAGVRQYNQLVALMDNWNAGDSDSMVSNLKTVENSTGELQKQADIYAESWEAARDRVTASAEAIYSKILDDDFFIGFLNGLSNVIDGVSNLIDAFGGLKGVLLTIGAFATKLFHDEMVEGLRNTIYNLKQLTPKGRNEQEKAREQALVGLKSLKSNMPGAEGTAENAALEREARMQEQLRAVVGRISNEELKQLQIQMDLVRTMDQRAIATAKAADAAREEVENARDLARAYDEIDARDKAKAKYMQNHQTQEIKERNAEQSAKQSKIAEMIDYGKNNRKTKKGEFGQYGNYINKIYRQAKDNIVKSGNTITPETIEQEFMSELNSAASQSGDKIATILLQKVNDAGKKAAQNFSENIKVEMNAAMNEAAKIANAEFDKQTKIVDKGAMAKARADDLKKTASSLLVDTTDVNGKSQRVYQGEDKDFNKVKDMVSKKLGNTIADAEALKKALEETNQSDDELDNVINNLKEMQKTLEDNELTAIKLQQILKQIEGSDIDANTNKENEENEGNDVAKILGDQSQMHSASAASYPYGGEMGPGTRAEQDYQQVLTAARREVDRQNAEFNVQSIENDLKGKFNKAGIQDWADQLTNATNIVMGLGSAITSVQGVIDVFNNPDASGWDKVMAIISTIVGILPVISSLFTMVKTGMAAALGPVGGIVLGITALITVFTLLSDAAHAASLEGQFEAASKAAEDAANAADKVRAEYDALNQSLKQLDSGIEAIQEMERGTLEWRAAIVDSNAALIELLSTYHMLSPDNFITDADGLMHITDEARKQLLEEQQKAVGEADNANYMAQVNKNNAESKLKASETVGANIAVMRTEIDNDGGTYTYDAATKGSTLSANIGQAIASALESGLIIDLNDKDSIVSALDSVAGLTEEEAQSVADQIAANAELQTSMLELSSAVMANTEANRILNNQIVDNAFGDQLNDLTQGMTDQQQELIKNRMGSDLKNLTDQIYESTYKDKFGGKWDETIQREYATKMQWSTDTIENLNGNKARYYAKDGTEIGVISDEVARRYLAQQAAIEQMGGSVQEYVNTLTNLIAEGDRLAKGTGQALGTFAGGKGGDFGSLTQEEFEALQNRKGEINLDNWKELGYESQEAYSKALEAAFTSYNNKQSKLTEGLSKTVADTFNNSDFSQLTLDAKEKVADSLQTAYDQIGKEGMTNLSTVFANAGENADKLNEILAGVDWSSPTALKDLNDQLKAQKIDVATLGPEWKDYVAQMLAAQDTVYGLINGLDKLRGIIVSISKITDDLKIGSVISDEDYELLLSYNSEIEHMFTMTADGWQFIGDIDELNRRLKTTTGDISKFKEEFQTARDAGAELIKSYGTSWKNEDGSISVGKGLASDTERASLMTNLINDSDYSAMVKTSGYSIERLAEVSDILQTQTDKSSAEYQEALAVMNNFYSSAQTFMNDYVAGKFTETNAEELWVNTYCNSLNELDGALASATISADTYNKMMDTVTRKEAEAFDLDYDDVIDQAKQLAKVYNLDESAARELAVQNQRMNKGVSNLIENWSDWKKVLKTTDKTSMDYVNTIQDVTATIADLVGASKDLELPEDFFDEAKGNMKLLEQAAQGSEEAINKLGLAVAQAQVEMMEFQKGMVNAKGIEISQTAFDSWKNTILTGITNLQDALNGIKIGENIYEQLGGDKWVNALNEMAVATGMSVAEMNSMLNSMGVKAEVSTAFKDTTVNVPWYKTQETISGGDNGTPIIKESHVIEQGFEPVKGQIEVAQINTGKNIGEKPKISYIGNGNISNSAKHSGSGSAPKKAEKKNKSDVVERYKEINDQLDDVADAMDDASKAADRLYGASRIKQMQKVNDLIQDEIELTKQKKKEALAYLEEDKQALFDAAAEAGVMLNIDESGLITNYTDAMTELYNELDSEISAANQDGNADEDEQKRIDQVQGRIDTLQGAIDQYDETRELIEDLDNELDEKFYEWQDNNAEMLNYKLELKLELNDMELEEIDYYLNKVADDFYRMAEAGAWMLNGVHPGDKGQLGTYLEELSEYEDQVKALANSYSQNEISQDAYIQGLKDVRSGIFENLEALQELDNTMMEYYGDTIAMAQDELAKYTDQMEHQSSVLEHYASILELIGKSNNYKTLGVVLQGQLEAAENRAAVAKKNMDMYKEQAEARYAEYQQALAAGDAAAAELYLNEYEAALQAANDAEEEYLSSVEEWGEKVKAVLENTMKGLAQTLENALTRGTSFDQLTTSLERAKSLQEEYLTTTNKIYETNKLMRTAQQAIDKSTNSVAKQKLKGFIEETQQLQDQSKLSQYELEIQQAKYNLLLAEIALQEAQDAKSMVRLQRDSEGNFGYVYTADQAAVGEAESNLLAAQNDLYNISLRGANDYTEKYQQTLNEMYDTLTNLQQQYLDGAFESEDEYNAAVIAAKDYYYQKLQDYSNLYTVAITTDNRVVADAWSTDFAEMTGNTENWMIAVNGYINDIQTAFGEYEAQMNAIATDSVGPDLDTLAEKTKNITEANDELLDKITNPEDGVIKGLEDQLTAVANLEKQYATFRDSLKLIEKSYEDITKAIQDTIRVQQQVVKNPQSINTTYDASQGGGTGSAATGDTGNEGGNPPGDTVPKEIPFIEPDDSTKSTIPTAPPGAIILYAAKSIGAKMGTYKVSSLSGLSFGTPSNAEDGSGVQMVWASGPGWSGYTTLNDYNALLDFFAGHSGRPGVPSPGRSRYENSIGFDTGGYTGSWDGAYGKLAFLHQKELVLNENDTKNFLASMEILERILQVIDLQSASAQIGGILSAPGFNSNREVLEQNVHIEASFPNATDHNEIEEAFGNLINLASQYANRK